MSFELFDPQGELQIRQGALPHWYQPGVTYFITFRTDDSIPQPLIAAWHRRRDDWLRRHQIDRSDPAWKQRLHAKGELEREYDRTFTRRYMDYLDRGYGRCALRRAELAEIVAASLRYGDDEQYHLGDFVVMPNHVHLLVCLLGETELEPLCRSWKHFTATKINKALGRDGHFWQQESFDHLVRSAASFERLQRYIADNPVKARLKPGEYLLSSNVAK